MFTARLIKICLGVMLATTLCSISRGQSQSDVREARTSKPIQGFEKRGGFVNFVSGEGRCVCVAQPNAHAKQPLTDGDTVELNDGHAELVLIPGYYLRLSANTTVRLLDLSRDNLKIEITRGSVIMEIPIEDSPELVPWLQELKDRFFNIVTVIAPGGE